MMRSKIIDVLNEIGGIFTIKFNSEMKAASGQFVMVWIPGVKEVPMSLSRIENPFSITFRVFGESTKALSQLKREDYMFYRGPYGNSYPVPSGRIAYIAGGTGMASLKSMIDKYEGDVYVGAKNKEELFFIKNGYHVATDDGSSGFKGTVVDLFLSTNRRYDYVFLCGPEPMMKSFIDKIPKKSETKIFMSIERLMKCGIGICDSCSINGYRVCKDGPIFNAELISKMDEFGISRRAQSGKIELFVSGKR